MPLSGPDIADQIQAALRRLLIATCVLYLLLFGAVGYVVWEVRNQHSSSARSTRALCALRSDLQSRVNNSRTFLTNHPRGLPGLGISAASLQSTIDGQLRTIIALSGLDCKR